MWTKIINYLVFGKFLIFYFYFNRLQDIINNLKKTHSDLEESKKMEIQKLTNQILKSQKSVLELEKKSDYLAIINDKKYMQVWDMNIKTANELIDKVILINFECDYWWNSLVKIFDDFLYILDFNGG